MFFLRKYDIKMIFLRSNIDGDDFIEKSRSNYFKVKHFDEFEELCKQWNLEILYGEHGLREGRLGFIISDENYYLEHPFMILKMNLLKI